MVPGHHHSLKKRGGSAKSFSETSFLPSSLFYPIYLLYLFAFYRALQNWRITSSIYWWPMVIIMALSKGVESWSSHHVKCPHNLAGLQTWPPMWYEELLPELSEEIKPGMHVQALVYTQRSHILYVMHNYYCIFGNYSFSMNTVFTLR